MTDAGDVLDRRIDGREFGTVKVEVLMVEAAHDLRVDDRADRIEAHGCIIANGNTDFDAVVVAMPIRIVALPEGRQVLRVGEFGKMQSVRRCKLESLGQDGECRRGTWHGRYQGGERGSPVESDGPKRACSVGEGSKGSRKKRADRSGAGSEELARIEAEKKAREEKREKDANIISKQLSQNLKIIIRYFRNNEEEFKIIKVL